IGTINPIKEIADITREKKITFFTDGVQAVGHIPVNVKELGVDMLSLSGHKFNAPKGVGALYIRRGVRVDAFMDGGGQERSKRGGTENLPYIIGMAKALEMAAERFDENDRLTALRNRLAEGLSKIPYSRVNGTLDSRLPGNINVAFEFVEGESLLLLLDANGICASTGSACSSASLEPSHVLLSIGVPVEIAHGSLRFSLSHNNTDEDVDYILEVVPKVVERLRMMSPLYDAAERK
ncbi:MAG: aminotransferase class V-fold PLP-dependent enzyme, partial [Clostridia bacterium]|nr:aminotransferase class V-fold PLP-dependent enzyme [Clostridia bacterium]